MLYHHPLVLLLLDVVEYTVLAFIWIHRLLSPPRKVADRGCPVHDLDIAACEPSAVWVRSTNLGHLTVIDLHYHDEHPKSVPVSQPSYSSPCGQTSACTLKPAIPEPSAYHCGAAGAAARIDAPASCATPALNKNTVDPFHSHPCELSNPHDMSIEDLQPAVEETPTELDFPSSCLEEEYNDVLQKFSHDRRNIIIESDCPQVAPHIVISPIETTWEDLCIQSSVLPYNLQGDRLTTPLHTCDFRECMPPLNHHVDTAAIDEGNVVCADALTETNEQGEDPPYHPEGFIVQSTPVRAMDAASKNRAFAERSSFPDLVTSLHRRMYRIAAHDAAEVAPNFTFRFECPEFASKVEKPFRWTDPAAALLTTLPRFRGTTIIESSCPFKVPHIIISESPPQHPYVEWYNSVGKPQDPQFLSAFPTLILCIGEEQADGSICPNTPALVSDKEVEDDEDEAEEYGEEEYWEEEYEEDGEGVAVACGDVLFNGGKVPRPCCSPFRDFENADREMDRERDDDEDGLPPFDDWYLTILNRTRP